MPQFFCSLGSSAPFLRPEGPSPAQLSIPGLLSSAPCKATLPFNPFCRTLGQRLFLPPPPITPDLICVFAFSQTVCSRSSRELEINSQAASLP